jgi:ubiquitin C-terminal hydrolase
MAAAIQCLSHATALSEYFLRDQHLASIIDDAGQLTQAYRKLLKCLWYPPELGKGESTSFSPTSFRDSLIERAPQFAGYRQHDAQEFLCVFLNLLHEEGRRLVPGKEGVLVANPDIAPRANVADEASEAWRCYLHQNRSVIVDLFHGQSRSTLSCACGHKASSFAPLVYLCLPVRSENTRVGFSDVGQCLRAYTSTERLSPKNGWRCPHCKVISEAEKKIDILKCPPLLVVHLKRFQFDAIVGSNVKLTDHVSFPVDGFDLSRFLPEVVHGDPSLYDLFAVINHMGSLLGGHYNAFIREGDSSVSSMVDAQVRDGWVCYDDKQLRNIDHSDLVSKAAYVLFYRRRTVQL